MVTKTATVSLHGNTYQVDAALAGRRVELVFSPFNLEHIEIRYQDKSYGKALPHNITRHAHPKARPETPETAPPAGHRDRLPRHDRRHPPRAGRRDETHQLHALYGHDDGQIPGQLSIDDILLRPTPTTTGEASA